MSGYWQFVKAVFIIANWVFFFSSLAIFVISSSAPSLLTSTPSATPSSLSCFTRFFPNVSFNLSLSPTCHLHPNIGDVFIVPADAIAESLCHEPHLHLVWVQRAALRQCSGLCLCQMGVLTWPRLPVILQNRNWCALLLCQSFQTRD
ncbi:hypothetical protein EYF80_017773 [Liparis tanakae]|uniref:Uncharacterized protein n=1 Tax=Liparis tanakae TaxID=230148 RepID=A0A4Z2I3C9_9TELE|nr:hypothetical protein EYF80_017773 [Liparis tanakae]